MKTSAIVRKTFAVGDMIRDAGLTTPDDIQRFDNIVYGEDKVWQSLDVYRPKAINKEEKLAVIVSVHGGGWVYGDKKTYQFYCMSLAQRGFAVVNFSYRLAPESKFPASIIDTNLVFGWILDHAEEYGFDTENIFAVGDSAGAYLLGLYINLCTNPEYAKVYKEKYGIQTPQDLKIRAVALNCGQYHFDLEEMNNEMTDNLMKEFLPEGGTQEELELVNVDTYVTEKFPPVYLMTAEKDFLKEQAPLLEKVLKEKKVPYIYSCYEGTKKKLEHVFHLNMKLADADRCNDAECKFFRHYEDRIN